MLQENEFYSFSELQQFELLQSYQDDALSSVEVQELFLNEIKNIEKDIIDLQKEYQNKKDILEKIGHEEERHAEVLGNIIQMMNNANEWVESAEFNHTKPY